MDGRVENQSSGKTASQIPRLFRWRRLEGGGIWWGWGHDGFGVKGQLQCDVETAGPHHFFHPTPDIWLDEWTWLGGSEGSIKSPTVSSLFFWTGVCCTQRMHYVCVTCERVCVCVLRYVCTRASACVYRCMCVWVYVCMCICMYMQMSMSLCVWVYIRVWASVCVKMYC